MSTDRNDRPEAAMHAVTMREFGDVLDDLSVDFTGTPPEVAATLLRHCLREKDGTASTLADVQGWTLSDRLHGLIRVALASDIASLTASLRCRECGELLEFELGLGDFLPQAGADVVPDFEFTPEPGHRLSVRLPTGADQLSWLARGESTADAMARALITAVDGEPPAQEWRMPEAWLAGLSDALKERDSLTALELKLQCPVCATENVAEYDLEQELLARLHHRQLRSLQDIHVLARNYHWSESEILALPRWRRRHYLNQIGSGGLA